MTGSTVGGAKDTNRSAIEQAKGFFYIYIRWGHDMHTFKEEMQILACTG